jgi:hypothetical protein
MCLKPLLLYHRVSASPDELTVAGEDESVLKLCRVLECDRADEYPSFGCHVEALKQISSELIGNCRKLEEGFQNLREEDAPVCERSVFISLHHPMITDAQMICLV